MQEFSFKTSKGAILRSMMERPETKKLIKRALSSPMGSTSRSKAKNIFSIMSKLNDKNDGAGGPGDVLGQMGYKNDTEQFQSIDKPKPTKGMVVFNRIPKSKINYTIKPTIVIEDGVGGPGDGRESYSGPSISSYLSSVGKDPSYSARAVLAANHGIQGYAGTADQNTQLLNQLRSGVASPDPMPLKTATNANSYSRGNTVNLPTFNTPSNKLSFSGVYPTSGGDPATLSKFNQGNNQNLSNIRPNMGELLRDPKLANYNFDLSGLDKDKNVAGVGVHGDPSPKRPWDIGYKPEKSYVTPTNKPKQKTFVPGTDRIKEGDFESLNKLPTTKRGVFTPPEAGQDSPEERGTVDAAGNPGNIGYKPETAGVFQIGQSGNRMDRNNNPTAFSLDVARQSSLVEGVDYIDTGDVWPDNPNQFTPKLLGDPVAITIKLIDELGFKQTDAPHGNRWGYTDKIQGANNTDWPNLSVEQKTAIIGQMYIQEGGGSSGGATSGPLSVESAVAGNMGAKGFAQQANQLPVGKDLRESVYDSYGIKETESLITKMQTAGATLPANVTTFIKTSDSALADIDRDIKEYTTDIMENMDMSDPGNAAKAKAQLGYLYTLRARQNQTYVGYLNDAVNQHQAQLDGLVAQKDIDLKYAQEEIDDGTADYERMSESLSSMYTEMKEAPELALRIRELQADVIIKEKLAIDAGIKKDEDLSYPVQKKKIQDMEIITDINGYTLPEADIQSVIINNDQDANSELKSGFILQTYMDSVIKTLNAQEKADVGPGDVISREYKAELAKTSIKQLLGLQNAIKDDDSMAGIFNSIEYMVQDIANSYGKSIAENIDDETASKIMEAVEDLAPGGPWYKLGMGHGTPQKEEEFIDAVKEKTGGTLDDAVAKAIYAAFRLASEAGGDNVSAPQDAVNSLLYPMSSTGDRASKEKRTPAEFAYLLGGIISDQFVQVILKELNEY